VDPRQYNRLLIRLLALPVISLGILALILGLGMQDVQRSARLVDHSDLIISHANHLFKLMVDEETGLRGYLLTRDPVFLQPFHEADRELDPEFGLLSSLVRLRPDQMARLQKPPCYQQDWEQNAYEEIKNPPPASEMEARMLGRKQDMDQLRAQTEDFIHAEEVIRISRSAVANRIDRSTMVGLIALAALVALFLVWRRGEFFINSPSFTIVNSKRSGFAQRSPMPVSSG